MPSLPTSSLLLQLTLRLGIISLWLLCWAGLASQAHASASSDYASTVLADKPLNYWRLSEESGPTAANAVFNGMSGRYFGPPALNQPGILPGNAAVSFDGESDYISVPYLAASATQDRVSLEMWAKRAKLNSSQGLLNNGGGSYQLYFDSANYLVLRRVGTGEIARSSIRLTDQARFHHLVVSKDGPLVRIYIDGLERTGAVTNRALLSSSSSLSIAGGSGFFKGSLDEIAIYNYPLAAATVSRHHAAGVSGTSPAPPPPAPPPPPPPPPPAPTSTVYVDIASRGGACHDARTVAQAGSPSTPWCSLQRAVDNVAAGSTVMIRAGNYPRLTISNKAYSRYTSLQGYQAERPSLAGLSVSASQFLRFQQLKLSDVTELKGAGNADIQFLGNEFTPSGVLADGAARLLFENNNFHDLNLLHNLSDEEKISPNYTGPHLHPPAPIANPIRCGSAQYGLIAIYPRCGSAFRGSGLTDLTFRNNRMVGIPADGIQFTNSKNVLIEGNYMERVRAFIDPKEHPDGIQAFGSNQNLSIRSNVFNNGGGSHSLIIHPHPNNQPGSFARKVLIEDNLFLGAFAMNLVNVEELVINHNTAVNTSLALALRQNTSQAGRMVNASVSNNILAQVESNSVNSTAFGAYHHNLIHNDAGRVSYRGTANLRGIAKFVNPALLDYRLRASSPGKNAASDGSDLGRGFWPVPPSR